MKFYIVTVQPHGGEKRVMADMIWHTERSARAYFDVVCKLYDQDHTIQLHEFEA